MRFAWLALVLGCGGSSPHTASPGLVDDDAVLAAVYLHEIDAAKAKPDEGLCLRVRDAAGATGDASGALFAAVHAKHAKAVPASACAGGGFDPVRVVSPDGPGVMFDIGPVVRDAKGIRVNGGGGHRGGGSAREVEYTIGKSGSSYRVASERVLLMN